MNVEFRQCVVSREIRALRAFDRRVFRKSDLFSSNDWKTYESYWMTVNGTVIGCCAFQRDVDFQEDVRADGDNPYMKRSLYIATTGILPRFQGGGFGQLLKCWQVSYAIHHGFTRIVTKNHPKKEPTNDFAQSKIWIQDYSRNSRLLLWPSRRDCSDGVEASCQIALHLIRFHFDAAFRV